MEGYRDAVVIPFSLFENKDVGSTEELVRVGYRYESYGGTTMSHHQLADWRPLGKLTNASLGGVIIEIILLKLILTELKIPL